MTTMRIHRDIFPRTDHGYTWVECVWFERDGKTVSPTIPSAGCCERLGHMPGGRFEPGSNYSLSQLWLDCVQNVLRSETTHDAYYRVGTVCIVPIGE